MTASPPAVPSRAAQLREALGAAMVDTAAERADACTCHDAYKGRGLIAPDCRHVEILALCDEVDRLRAALPDALAVIEAAERYRQCAMVASGGDLPEADELADEAWDALTVALAAWEAGK